jgi:ParB family chromosome partitioning protein
LRLFQLPPGIQRLVVDGQLSAGHARALLGTPDRAFQEALARRSVAEELSVRAVEEAVRLRNELTQPGSTAPPGVPAGPVPSPTPLRPAGLHALEELLADHLDTRVKIDIGSRKGRLVVDFADLDDLERIYRRMTEAGSTNA